MPSSGRPSAPAVDRPRRRTAAVRRRRPGWVPDQHGAWAMLTAPVVAGVALAGPAWEHVPLVVLWWVGYFAFFAVGLWLRSGRKARYLPAARTYCLLCLPLGLAVLVVSPHLVRWVPVYLPLVLVSAWASAHRRDRSLLNDAVTVLAATLMTAVAYDAPLDGATPVTAVAGLPGSSPDGTLQGWAWTWTVTALLLAYFWGTVPYVKTLIRERGNPRYRAGSAIYHLVAAGAVLALALAGPVRGAHAAVWVLLAARAVLVPAYQARRGRPLPPVAIGVGEIVASILVLVSLLA